MNRTTALLLAMAALLAHAIALHLEPDGRLGQPFEESHAAFRLARNWVHEGLLVWNPGEDAASGLRGGLGSHASPLLVAISALAERLLLPVNRVVQILGAVAALLTISTSTRFAVDRSAGIIPALLLVTSGTFATAAGSGTELPFLTFALALAFVARERRRTLLFALGMLMLVSVCAEGLVMASVLALFAIGERRRREGGPRPTPLWSLGPALVAGIALALAPDGYGGRLYLATLADLNPALVPEGLRYLADFSITAVTPALVLFPLGGLLVGRLKPEGARALLLAGVWLGLILFEGGGVAPFAASLAPMLPLLAIAVQFGVIAALDRRRPALEALCWAALIVTSLGSALASKGASTMHWHQAWLEDSFARPALGREPLRGRSSLQEELRETKDMRALGRFLREQVDTELSVAAPWTGALGYLADRTVIDMSGRRTASRAGRRPAWPVRRPLDLVACLEQRPDLLLPMRISDNKQLQQRGTQLGLDPEWLASLQLEVDARRHLLTTLENYELVTVPVADERDPRSYGGQPIRLLRRRDLDLAPRLTLRVESGDLVVEVASSPAGRGHPQLVHLELAAVDAAGDRYLVDPRGRLHAEDSIHARTGLLVDHGDGRPVQLFRAPLPEAGQPLREIRARLLNPRMREEHPLAACSATVVHAFE